MLVFTHMPLTWGRPELLGPPWSPRTHWAAPHHMAFSEAVSPSLRGAGCVLQLSSFMDLGKRSVWPPSSPFSLETPLKGQAPNPGFIRVLILCKKCVRALHRLRIFYGLILGPHYEINRGRGEIVALINLTSPAVPKA